MGLRSPVDVSTEVRNSVGVPTGWCGLAAADQLHPLVAVSMLSLILVYMLIM